MFSISVLTLGFLSLAALWGEGEGHGRMLDPPARPSMWRFGFRTPKDYTDNGHNCGGTYHQAQVNNGKCGICGDAYELPQPRPRENGGMYGTGTIAKTYKTGDTIPVKVEITAAHQGYMEFRLCKLVDRSKPATEECLNQNLLKFEDGTTRYTDIGTRAMMHNMRVKLPAGLSCKQCVFQWKYRAGNNAGSIQEEFYGCADVAISPDADASVNMPAPAPMPTTTMASAPMTKYLCNFKDNPDNDVQLNELCDYACDLDMGTCKNPYCFCFPS